MFFYLIVTAAVPAAVVGALGGNLHNLTICHHRLFRGTESAGQQAGAAAGTRELNVSVGAVAAGVEGGVLQGALVLVIVNALVVGAVPVAALGAVGLGEQGGVRKIVQSWRYSRGIRAQQAGWARHFLFTTSTF